MARKAAKKVEEAASAEPAQTIISIKGFDHNLSCRGYQFEIGKSYEVSGAIKACSNGFHACPIEHHPLSVLEFYPPTSRFCVVEQSGDTSAEGTKLASAKITIGVEISISDLAQRAVKWVFDRANWLQGSVATGENEGATASGTQGAATASGTQGAATASGIGGKARGREGAALFLVERLGGSSDDRGKILSVWAGIVGRDGIKPDTFYMLRDGQPVEVEA